MFARTALTALTAAAIALSGSAAFAAQAEPGNSVPVRYGDLDLTTDAGVARLNQRIKYAARKACGHADIRDLTRNAAIQACRNSAMSKATPEAELAVAAAKKGESYASARTINVHTR